MVSAEALEILCSTTLIITRERVRAFGMTAQGQVSGGRKSGPWEKTEENGNERSRVEKDTGANYNSKKKT